MLTELILTLMVELFLNVGYTQQVASKGSNRVESIKILRPL